MKFMYISQRQIQLLIHVKNVVHIDKAQYHHFSTWKSCFERGWIKINQAHVMLTRMGELVLATFTHMKYRMLIENVREDMIAKMRSVKRNAKR